MDLREYVSAYYCCAINHIPLWAIDPLLQNIEATTWDRHALHMWPKYHRSYKSFNIRFGGGEIAGINTVPYKVGDWFGMQAALEWSDDLLGGSELESEIDVGGLL